MTVRRFVRDAICVCVVFAACTQIGAVERRAVIARRPIRGSSAQAKESAVSTAAAPGHRALLDKYCVTCHNERQKTANLLLDKADLDRVSANPELWERVVRKLRAEAMPPAGLPHPDKAASVALATWLETTIDGAAAAAPNPGRPVLHRLNRAEYSNAIRDLLAFDVDGRTLLPVDDSGYGFDNIADVLTVSPTLFERYMLAAQKISRLAVGDPTIPADSAIYKVPRLAWQDDQMSPDSPFGSRGGVAIRHYFPVDGTYEFRMEIARDTLGRGVARGLDVRTAIDVRIDGVPVKLFSMGGRNRAGASEPESTNLGGTGLKVSAAIKAGSRLVQVSFPKTTWAYEGVGPERMPRASSSLAHATSTEPMYGRVEAELDVLQVAGPYDVTGTGDTPSRRRIFVCRPVSAADETPCAAKILGTLARLAYRRPLTKDDLDPLVGLYKAGRRDGDFERGIQFALEKILVSPDFLFRVERDPSQARAGIAYRISGLELASRLSFFLWSSIPDSELLDVAVRGDLESPAVLQRQVRRMLADSRADALIENFGGQWLYLRNLRTVTRDDVAYPSFDENLREAFKRETELLLQSQLREDRPIPDILTADYTFVNERLARHYGIPNVYGSRFRRIAYPDSRRAGLLGHGSILTVTSYAHRTSPVVRGKWLLENLLGSPPPDPPANVPPLNEGAEEGQVLSVRQKMERHRKNPVCASCHKVMDPLGFALENFDALGRWRTSDGGAAIDPSGTFPNGTKFDGPSQFRSVLLNYRERFVETTVRKLMAYALGRGLEPYDMPAVRAVMREATPQDYRWSAVILAIVKSTPFQMRRAES